jgi:hypothetical protein
VELALREIMGLAILTVPPAPAAVTADNGNKRK